MKRSIILAALLLAGAAANAQSAANAQGVSYSYAQLAYQRVSASGGYNGDGYLLAGSIGFNDHWYGIVRLGNADLSRGTTLGQLGIGAGYHTALTANTDFFATLEYIEVDASANGFGGIGDNGYGAKIGARGMITPKFELQGTLGYADLGGGSNTTTLGVAGWYSFGGKFAAGITIDVEEDVDIFGLNLRWFFDR